MPTPDEYTGPVLGLDIGGTSVKAAVLRESGEAVFGQSAAYRHPDQAQLRAAIHEAIEATGFKQPYSRAGICAPGRRAPDGRSIEHAVNVPGIENVPLSDLVQTDHATIASDAHAAAYDYWFVHKPRGRLLAISLGTGVGACVLDDGEPLYVESQTPGHFGQIDVGPCDPAQPIAPDNGRNGLEAYIGLPALHARFGGTISTMGPHIEALSRAIRIAHAIYRPQAIALLGGVGLALAPGLDELNRAVSTDLTSVADPDCRISCGDHLHHAAAGAARLANNPS